MKRSKTWAIIGGGNGGQAMAGHLAVLGQKVRLYDISQKTVDELNEKGVITITNGLEGTGPIEFATTDMSKAMEGADNIILVLPSLYHESMAKKMVPCLKDGMTVLLHPEASCGAIAFRKVMTDMNCTSDVVVGAASTLLYATRLLKNGEVFIGGVKTAVPIAALPATDNARLEAAICGIMPRFTIVGSVLETSIDNLNAMMHPAPMLLSTSRIESEPFTPFQYYLEGITPSIGKFIEAMDLERIAIAKELGYKQRTVREAYVEMYSCGEVGIPLHQLVRDNPSYDGLMAADTLKTRYVLEDIPYSLVALQSLAEIAGVPTPCIDAIVTIGRAVMGDALDEGRTLKALGLENMDKQALLNYVLG